MCGLIGAIDSNISAENFRIAQKSIFHRGPDSSGSHIDKELNLYLGFSRLAIQDLSEAGNQPMYSENGLYTLLFNGEIYNFLMLKEELKKLEYRFKSNSDSEVILAGFQLWGLEVLLEKLDGMFSIVLVDKSLKQIHLIRDPFGIKPLFYYLDQNVFYFASEIKPILKMFPKYEIDLQNLEKSIYFTSLPRNRGSNIKGVNRVLPGECVTLNLNTMQIKEFMYFQIKDLIDKAEYAENSKLSRKDIARKLGDLLKCNVESTLISDAKLGVLFSGGLDSSIIARFTNQSQEIKPKCFSLLNAESEEPIKKFVAKFKNDLSFVTSDNNETFKNLGSLIYSLEDINKAEAWVLGKVCKEAKNQGYKSLVTGDGADELFAGYNDHALFYIQNKIKSIKILSFLEKSLIENGFDKFTNLFSTIKPARVELIEAPIDLLVNKGKGMSSFEKAMKVYEFEENYPVRAANALLYEELNFWIERFMLRADRFSMINSVELRLPFLRRDIVRFAINTPFNKKIKFGLNVSSKRLFESKSILRDLAQELGIPNRIIRQRKIGTTFSNHETILKLFSNWDFSILKDLLGIEINQKKDSYFSNPDRLMVSLICGDIFLRIFYHHITPDEVNNELARILI